MKVSDTMLAAAMQAAPGVTEEQIRAIFASAGAGQIIFNTDEGSEVVDGKTKWPSLLQVSIADPAFALQVAQQLLAGAARGFARKDDTANISLLFAGQAVVSE